MSRELVMIHPSNLEDYSVGLGLTVGVRYNSPDIRKVRFEGGATQWDVGGLIVVRCFEEEGASGEEFCL